MNFGEFFLWFLMGDKEFLIEYVCTHASVSVANIDQLVLFLFLLHKSLDDFQNPTTIYYNINVI